MVAITTTPPTAVPATGEGDAALLARVATGEHAAFGLLYDRFAPRVHSLARRLCCVDTILDDVAQEVFATVWATAGRFDPARGSVAIWVLTVTHHKTVDALRREATVRRYTPPVPDHDERDLPPEPGADQAAIGSVVATHVRDALAELPTRSARRWCWPTTAATPTPRSSRSSASRWAP